MLERKRFIEDLPIIDVYRMVARGVGATDREILSGDVNTSENKENLKYNRYIDLKATTLRDQSSTV
jgi:hypothetical protein